jgi:hypothetical protein
MPKGIRNDGGRCGRPSFAPIRELDAFLQGTGGPSPWVQALKWEYEKANLHLWTNAKICQVASIFRCTVHELCAVAGLFDRKEIARHLKENKWPLYLAIQFDKLVKFKLGLRDVHVQDALAAKGLVWDNEEAA